MLAVVAFLLPRAVGGTGRIHPDEVYQTVEQAHRLVFGYGMVPWEFSAGTRSWLGPALVVPPIWLADRFAALTGTATTGELLLTAVRVWLVGWAALTVWGTAVLGRRLGGRAAGVLAAVLVGFAPVTSAFLTHAFTDTLCLPLVVWAFAAVLSRRPRAWWLGGAAVALAVALRPQVAVLALGLLLLARRQGPQTARGVLGGAAAGAAAWGLLDVATWGLPFGSAWRSIEFNVLLGGAETFGSEPWWFFGARVVQLLGVVAAVVLAAGVLLAPRRAGWVVLTCAGYVVVLSAIGHKEVRFVLPALPLLAAVSAAGLVRAGDAVAAALRRSPVRVAQLRDPGGYARGFTVAVTLAVCAAGWSTADLSAVRPPRGADAAAADRALSAAGALPATCGVAVVAPSLGWTGGLVALHRDVPLVLVPAAQAARGRIPDYLDTVVVPGSVALGGRWRTMAVDGPVRVEQRTGGCAPPPPTYSTRWPQPKAAPKM